MCQFATRLAPTFSNDGLRFGASEGPALTPAADRRCRLFPEAPASRSPPSLDTPNREPAGLFAAMTESAGVGDRHKPR